MPKQKQVFAYDDDYLKLGFISVEVNGKVRPQCVLCLKVLAHSSLKKKQTFVGTEKQTMKNSSTKLLMCLKKKNIR